jgi:hypothetical protein
VGSRHRQGEHGRHEDDDHGQRSLTFEMWAKGPDGKKMKMMEIKYTRKK